MAATFDYAVRYLVTATCETPFRTGGSDGDTEQLLCASNGTLLIQASSIAGACRAWLEKNAEPYTVHELFGSQKKGGRLIFSDAAFEPDTQISSRPRLRINASTGAAANGGKFDVTQIGRGAKCHFSVVWLGTQSLEQQLVPLRQILSALNGGDIRLGAQKTNGFGRFSIQVMQQKYRMTDPTDRENWITDKGKPEPVGLSEEAPRQDVVFTVFARADNLLVKSGAAVQKESGSYMPTLTENGAAVIPGSSVKGLIRAQATKIGRFVGLSDRDINGIFGTQAEGDSNGTAGKVIFEDAVITGEARREINRIRIDRFTGGAIRGALFCEEPVSGQFALTVRAPQDGVACALLLYALRDLGLGLCNLGGNGAIGRGITAIDRIEICAPQGVSASLGFRQGKPTLQDPCGLVEAWLNKWREICP